MDLSVEANQWRKRKSVGNNPLVDFIQTPYAQGKNDFLMYYRVELHPGAKMKMAGSIILTRPSSA